MGPLLPTVADAVEDATVQLQPTSANAADDAKKAHTFAQVAKARGNKSVVRRGVVRLVTPGTLTEDTLLDARARPEKRE